MSVALVGGRVGPEDVAEERGAVAEEFLVEGPVRVFGPDVDVDYVVGEESGGVVEVRERAMGGVRRDWVAYSLSGFSLGSPGFAMIMGDRWV